MEEMTIYIHNILIQRPASLFRGFVLSHTSDVVNYVVGHVVLSVLVCPGSSQCCALCCDERCGEDVSCTYIVIITVYMYKPVEGSCDCDVRL